MQNEIAPTEAATSAGASMVKAWSAFNIDNTLGSQAVNTAEIIATRHMISMPLAREVVRLADLGPREG